MSFITNIKSASIFAASIFLFDCKETSGLHPGIMINRTKAVPLYIETLKKQVQEDDIGKFSWHNDSENDQTKIENKIAIPTTSYTKSQNLILNSKRNILFDIIKSELSDFTILKLDEKNFIIETELKEIPIANIKRKIKINISEIKKININIEIYDEKSIRHKQEEQILKKKILNKYNSTLNSMKF